MNTQSRELANSATHDKLSVVASMAAQYGMRHDAFEATLRGTVVPSLTTREEFAAFVLVAKHYGLNPILREIHAIPKKGGGIQPVVGVDGWFRLANEHPQFDGIEFEDHLDESGNIEAITCRIWRKDRSRPSAAKEWLVECQQSSEPWRKMPRRMLRHKAAIQTARIAFGFAGIMEPDEAENVRGQERQAQQRYVEQHAARRIEAQETIDAETGEILAPTGKLSERANEARERARTPPEDAILNADADYLRETVQKAAAAPKQTRRPRKTANEKLAEAEGRTYVTPQDAAPPAEPLPENITPKKEAEPNENLIRDYEAKKKMSPAEEALREAEPEMAAQYLDGGEVSSDDDGIDDDDPQVAAFRDGWVARTKLKARGAVGDYQGNAELTQFFHRGWDTMAKHYEANTHPKTAQESMEMLDIILDRIFN